MEVWREVFGQDAGTPGVPEGWDHPNGGRASSHCRLATKVLQQLLYASGTRTTGLPRLLMKTQELPPAQGITVKGEAVGRAVAGMCCRLMTARCDQHFSAIACTRRTPLVTCCPQTMERRFTEAYDTIYGTTFARPIAEYGSVNGAGEKINNVTITFRD